MIPLARDRLVALVRHDDPLARAEMVDPATLSQQEFILTKGGSAARASMVRANRT